MKLTIRPWVPGLLLLIALLALLQYRWWNGPGGRRDLDAVRSRVTTQTAENAARQKRNDALRAEVHDLKDPSSGGAAIEERARNELGMARPDETFYRVVSPAGSDLPAPVDARQAAGAKPR